MSISELTSWFDWFRPRNKPKDEVLSLFGAKKERRTNKDLSKLYILRVDFPVNDQQRVIIDAALDPLREKYGIDFFLLEPGIRLSRFDDI
jgi:hypothetical protein